MRFRALVLGAGIGLLGLIYSAHGATGTISYKIGTGAVQTTTSEQDFTITIPTTVSGTVLLRIWDDSFGSGGLADDGVARSRLQAVGRLAASCRF